MPLEWAMACNDTFLTLFKTTLNTEDVIFSRPQSGLLLKLLVDESETQGEAFQAVG